MRFSQRIGEVTQKPIQFKSMDEPLRNRLYNILNNTFPKQSGYYSAYDSLRIYVLDKLGFNVEYEETDDFNQEFLSGEWFMPYDIFEFIFEWIDCEEGSRFGYIDKREFVLNIQRILEEEKSGYRILNYSFVPITNEAELSSIQESTHTEYAAVNTHMGKAVTLYSGRTNPDYENSIKESISAVEAMCCIITGLPKATLKEALRKLKDRGVLIHGAMEKAFSQLYGYTSDENGIRHGGIDFAKAPAEDAKYMLLTCSAFVNYLIEKYVQIGGNPNE